MTCDEAIRAIEAMLDGEIESGERFQLEAHLAGCEACRREVEERRAFSDRLGRSLHEALGAAAPKARPVVRPPTRVPWMRIAAVLLVGVIVGYAGTTSRLFQATPAEARDVANLLALKDGYEREERSLASRLEKAAGALDHQVSRTREGALRDVGSIGVANAAMGLAGREPMALPQEPAQRGPYVARKLSSPDWAVRGQAVKAMRTLSAGEMSQLKEKVVLLNGANRDLVELVALSIDPPSEPAIDVSVEAQNLKTRFVQYRDGRVRVERAGAGGPEVYEAANVIEFRGAHPVVTANLRLQGVDGDVVVGGVRQKSAAVSSRPAAYAPAVLWGTPAGSSERAVMAMTYQALVTDLARSGLKSEEAESRATQIVDLIRAGSGVPSAAVRADPARVEIHLTAVRLWDRTRLVAERERLQEEVALLRQHLAENERRLDYVRTAQETLKAAVR